jgi:hypothetical protein
VKNLSISRFDGIDFVKFNTIFSDADVLLWEQEGVISMFDWRKAEEHLNACEKSYAALSSGGYLVLNYVIGPLRERLNKGERTAELWKEIMATQ